MIILPKAIDMAGTTGGRRTGRGAGLWCTSALVAALALGVGSQHLSAQVVWSGATDTDWTEGGNWVGNTAPVPGDTAQIDAVTGNAPVILGADSVTVNIASVTADTLTVDGTLSVTTALNVTGAGSVVINGAVNGVVNSSGTGTNAGTINGGLEVFGGSFTNTGVVTGPTTLTGGTLTLDPGSNLSDTATLTLTGGTLNVNTADTVGALDSGLPQGTINFGAGGVLTTNTGGAPVFGGNITGATTLGAEYLVKDGAGTLTLSGENTTTGAGRLRVVGGTLVLQGGNAVGDNNILEAAGGTIELQADESAGVLLGLGTGTLNLNANTLTLLGPGVGGDADTSVNVIGTGGITINAPGLVHRFDAPLAYTGATTVTAGTFQVGADDIIADASAVVINGGTLDLQGFGDTVASLTMSSGTLAGTGTLTTTGDANLSGGTIESTLTVGGTTTIAGGATTVTGTITGDVTVGAGGTLRIEAGSSFGGTITTTGSLIDYADGADLAAPIVIDSDTTQVRVLTGTATQSGIISEDNGPRPLEKIGGGTLILTAENTYTGTTTITAGTLALANAGSTLVDTNAVVIGADGTLRLDADETLGSIAGDGAINLQANTLTIGGEVAPTATTFSGIIGGAGELVIGGGDTTLTGANTYTGGTTVSGGALTVSGAGTLGGAGSDVSLNGGTLTINNDQDVTLTQDGGVLAGTGSVTNLARTGGTDSSTLDALRRATAIGGTVSLIGLGGIAASNTGAGDVEIETATGGFINTVAGNGITASTEDGDITITAGDDVTGDVGISANSTGGGTITVTIAETVEGAITRGVSITNNDGDVTVQGASGDVIGATDGIAITSGGGDILVQNLDSVTGLDGDGLNLDSDGGLITVLNVGEILGTGGSGIVADAGDGSISIQGSGLVGGIEGTDGLGISASSTGGNIGIGDVDVNGAVTGSTFGIAAQTTGLGTVTIATGGAVEGTGGGGIAAQSVDGAIEITTDGTVTAGDGVGIFAQTVAGPVTIVANDEVSGAGINGEGIRAQTSSGPIDITADGNVSGDLVGINASTATGTVTIDGSGDIDGDGRGIQVVASGAGDIIITPSGNVTSASGIGIRGISAGGNVQIAPTGTVDAGLIGIDAATTGTGTITVTTTAALGGTTAPSQFGIRTSAVDGDTEVTVGGDLTSGGVGVEAVATGDGDVTVEGSGEIDSDGSGIVADANAGDVLVEYDGDITTATGSGIDASSTDGTVTVVSGGVITGGATGITATGTTGDVTVTANAAVTGETDEGIAASNDTGNVTVNANADVTGGQTGILSTISGAGDSEIDVADGVTVQGAEIGISASLGGGDGTIGIGTDASVISGVNPDGTTAGPASTAILADTGAGTTTVNNAGTVQATNNVNSLGLSATGAGDFVFNNLAGGVGLGMMASDAGAGVVTVNNQAGATWTLNSFGSSVMAGGDDTLNNSGTFNLQSFSSLTGWEVIDNDGIINMDAFSTLGGAAITNTGTINANVGALQSATLIGNLDNTGGTISLNTGTAGGQLIVDGNFNAGGGTVALDVNLTALDNGLADFLQIDGNATGGVVLDLTSVGTGTAPQGVPITLISATDLSGLTLDGVNTSGFVLGGGLISYNVVENFADNEIQLIGAPSPIIGGVSANAAIVQALVGSIVNRPSGAFVSGLQVDTPDNCAVGGWGRLTGGSARATAFTRSGVFNTPARVSASFVGVQGGFDYGCYEDFIDGWDLVAGLTVGANSGISTQNIFALDGGGNPIGPPVSQTTASFDQTYGGAYFAFFRQNLGGDVQLRHDRTRFVFNNDLGTDVQDVSYDTSATTLSGSMSYYYELSNGLSLVPAAGFSISRSRGGQMTFSDGPPGSTLQVHPHTSRLVFGGATLANTTIAEAGDSATTHFVTATVYSDISGVRRSTFTPTGGGAPVDLETSNLGTFGELSVGLGHVRVLDAQTAGAAKQLDASIRADARLSNRVQAIGLTAQVRFKF